MYHHLGSASSSSTSLQSGGLQVVSRFLYCVGNRSSEMLCRPHPSRIVVQRMGRLLVHSPQSTPCSICVSFDGGRLFGWVSLLSSPSLSCPLLRNDVVSTTALTIIVSRTYGAWLLAEGCLLMLVLSRYVMSSCRLFLSCGIISNAFFAASLSPAKYNK